MATDADSTSEMNWDFVRQLFGLSTPQANYQPWRQPTIPPYVRMRRGNYGAAKQGMRRPVRRKRE